MGENHIPGLERVTHADSDYIATVNHILRVCPELLASISIGQTGEIIIQSHSANRLNTAKVIECLEKTLAHLKKENVEVVDMAEEDTIVNDYPYPDQIVFTVDEWCMGYRENNDLYWLYLALNSVDSRIERVQPFGQGFVMVSFKKPFLDDYQHLYSIEGIDLEMPAMGQYTAIAT